jgi:hypothetical protein
MLDDGYLRDWKWCYGRLVDVENEHPQIWHSARLYMDIPDRLEHSELKTLGLFAVLESLLTHNPRGDEDSISHQIRSKVALVEKRLERAIDYSAFGSARPETIWQRLYEFRSRIAHGTPVSFDRQLQVLDDGDTVERFMWHAVRSVLRGALKEPSLFIDLKAV